MSVKKGLRCVSKKDWTGVKENSLSTKSAATKASIVSARHLGGSEADTQYVTQPPASRSAS